MDVRLTPEGVRILSEKRRVMLEYFLQCFNTGNMTISGLDSCQLRWLASDNYIWGDLVYEQIPKVRDELEERKLEPEL